MRSSIRVWWLRRVGITQVDLRSYHSLLLCRNLRSLYLILKFLAVVKEIQENNSSGCFIGLCKINYVNGKCFTQCLVQCNHSKVFILSISFLLIACFMTYMLSSSINFLEYRDIILKYLYYLNKYHGMLNTPGKLISYSTKLKV